MGVESNPHLLTSFHPSILTSFNPQIHKDSKKYLVVVSWYSLDMYIPSRIENSENFLFQAYFFLGIRIVRNRDHSLITTLACWGVI